MNRNAISVKKENQYIGESINNFPFYYKLTNLVVCKSDDATINNGQETTDEIIDKHINQYSEVFEALF